ATGECLGALGSDTGGSIRIPSGWCGVTGLKPTYGMVSKAGVIPLSWSLDHVGPIARTVEDCALLLDVIAGYDPSDPDSVDTPVSSYTSALAAASSPDEVIRGMRIGIPTTYFFDLLGPEVEAAVRIAIAQFAAFGAQVEDVLLPTALDDLFPVYRAIQKPEAFTYHQDQGWLDQRADLYAPEVYANIRSGGDYSAPDYIRAQQTRRRFTDDMRAVFQRLDVLAMPTLAIPAPRIEDYARPLTVNGQEITSGGSLRYTFPFDLTGQPALALPCGFTKSGLPISLQLVAAHFDEPALLRLGHAYQRLTDWHRRLPPIAIPQP
ncbi:MAG TPA: amidase, partial [Ktedonobacterales bacterium]|nr:amidase [Ktedonobacterales bacterium]